MKKENNKKQHKKVLKKKIKLSDGINIHDRFLPAE